MARFAGDLVDLTFWQVIVGAVGITLLLITLKLTRDANKAAIRAAKAAEDAVEVTRDMAKRQLRAFVFGKGFELGLSLWNGAISGYMIFVRWENSGLTPATDVRSWIRFIEFPMIENREVTFTKVENPIPTVLGPQSSIQSGYITIPLQTVMEKWQRQTEILVWARVEYRDTFDPGVIRHHEKCAILEVIHDPSEIPPKDHPAYVMFKIYGPQNTTG